MKTEVNFIVHCAFRYGLRNPGGQRPGERLSERLSIDPLEPTGHEKVLVAQPSYPGPTSLEVGLDRLRQSLQDGDESKVREELLAMASTNLSLMDSEMQAIDLRDDEVIDLRDDEVIELADGGRFGLAPFGGGDSAQSGN